MSWINFGCTYEKIPFPGLRLLINNWTASIQKTLLGAFPSDRRPAGKENFQKKIISLLSKVFLYAVYRRFRTSSSFLNGNPR